MSPRNPIPPDQTDEQAQAEAEGPSDPNAPDPAPDDAPAAKNTGELVVDVHSNLNIGGQVVNAGETGVTIPDTAEARAAIAVGHLSVSEDE